MTALNGPILFNSSTGNDSTASGLGPSVAVIGSSAELDGTSTVDVSFDMASLSGISSGDLLFCDTTSGRKFSVIASVDTLSGTITTDDSWGTESGVSWAVGGKRATFDDVSSRQLFTESAGWVFETETNQSLTSAIACPNGGGRHEFRGASGSIKTITQTADARNFDGGNNNSSILTLRNLKLENSNASKTSAWGLAARRQIYCYDCVFGDATNTLLYGHSRAGDYPNGIFENCVFQYCTSSEAAFFVVGSSGYTIKNCVFRNNVGSGMKTYQFSMFVLNSIFHDNGTDGWVVSIGASRSMIVQGNIFYGNTRDGMGTLNNSGGTNYSLFTENIFAENGRYGLYHNSASALLTKNAFYGNTTAETFGSSTVNNITLTADPFVDAANGDFSLNSDAGGGAVLRAETMVMGSTTTYPFNRLTDGSGGGGSGSAVHPLYAN